MNYAKRPAGKAINWKKEDADNLAAEPGPHIHRHLRGQGALPDYRKYPRMSCNGLLPGARKLGGTYGKVDGVESPETADLIDALKHIPKLRGSHVLVIGSEVDDCTAMPLHH